jgi:hypothetical protein
MTRTTLDLDPTILRDLKKRQKREGKSLGQLVSELLAAPLADDRPRQAPEFRWISKDMGLRIDLEDKDALWRALDE